MCTRPDSSLAAVASLVLELCFFWKADKLALAGQSCYASLLCRKATSVDAWDSMDHDARQLWRLTRVGQSGGMAIEASKRANACGPTWLSLDHECHICSACLTAFMQSVGLGPGHANCSLGSFITADTACASGSVHLNKTPTSAWVVECADGKRKCLLTLPVGRQHVLATVHRHAPYTYFK